MDYFAIKKERHFQRHGFLCINSAMIV